MNELKFRIKMRIDMAKYTLPEFAGIIGITENQAVAMMKYAYFDMKRSERFWNRIYKDMVRIDKIIWLKPQEIIRKARDKRRRAD